MFNKAAVAEKTCSPLYKFQSTSKDKQRDQLACCSVTPQGRRIFRKDIHVRTQPARNSQAPGRTGGRVCTKPPLSSVFCPDLSGILFQCLMGFRLPLLCVWHWAQNGQLSPVSRAKEGGTASSFPPPPDVQVTHPGDLAGLYPDRPPESRVLGPRLKEGK